MSSLPARIAGLSLLAAAAGAMADEPLIVAGVEAPEPGLLCADAADATRVHFHFNAAAAEFRRMTIYVDGIAADPEDVDQSWPGITLDGGLHPGRNDVEIVATRADGARVSRRLPVTIAATATNEGAYIPCGRAAVVLEEEPEVVYEQPGYVHRTQVIYEDAPAYVYESYPAYAEYAPVAPLISFDLYSSRYHPPHHEHDGSYRQGGYGHGGGSDGGWHERDSANGHHQFHEHGESNEQVDRQQHGHYGPYVQPNAPTATGQTESGGHHGHGGGNASTPAPAAQPPRQQGNNSPHGAYGDHPRWGSTAQPGPSRRERTQ